jgi:hypothetical protein
MSRKPKPEPLPEWVTKVVQWLGIATTLIGAVGTAARSRQVW